MRVSFDKKHDSRSATIKYTGRLHFNHCITGFWLDPRAHVHGYFYLAPQSVAKVEFDDIKGHGPNLLSYRADTHAYCVELSDGMFNELFTSMKYFMNQLQTPHSVILGLRTTYQLLTIVKMFESHLESLNKLFNSSKTSSAAKAEMKMTLDNIPIDDESKIIELKEKIQVAEEEYKKKQEAKKEKERNAECDNNDENKDETKEAEEKKENEDENKKDAENKEAQEEPEIKEKYPDILSIHNLRAILMF